MIRFLLDGSLHEWPAGSSLPAGAIFVTVAEAEAFKNPPERAALLAAEVERAASAALIAAIGGRAAVLLALLEDDAVKLADLRAKLAAERLKT